MGASDKAPPQGVNYDASALPADPHPLTNVLVMGVGFFFVMGGYNPVQSFASSLLNFECIPMGDISIGVVSCRAISLLNVRRIAAPTFPTARVKQPRLPIPFEYVFSSLLTSSVSFPGLCIAGAGVAVCAGSDCQGRSSGVHGVRLARLRHVRCLGGLHCVARCSAGVACDRFSWVSLRKNSWS